MCASLVVLEETYVQLNDICVIHVYICRKCAINMRQTCVSEVVIKYYYHIILCMIIEVIVVIFNVIIIIYSV